MRPHGAPGRFRVAGLRALRAVVGAELRRSWVSQASIRIMIVLLSVGAGSLESTMTEDLSPAERYAAARRRAVEQATALASFREMYDFGLDPFQIEACQALEAGKGVLVAAPTGSGKTIVGEFAVHLALQQGKKCFYTTPIKALSNQKYADLSRRYGADKVGLLTGDNSVNSDAPVVVMTTEVLRNMLYAGSQTLLGLGYVVMDEVHYLSDRFRGAVWEEVIIRLPSRSPSSRCRPPCPTPRSSATGSTPSAVTPR